MLLSLARNLFNLSINQITVPKVATKVYLAQRICLNHTTSESNPIETSCDQQDKKIPEEDKALYKKWLELSKRNLISAYQLYISKNKDAILKDLLENRTRPVKKTNVVYLCADKWRNLPFEERLTYYQEYQKYLKESKESLVYKAFCASLTPEQLENFSLIKKLNSLERKKKKILAKILADEKKHDKPQRPLTGFKLFFQDYLQTHIKSTKEANTVKFDTTLRKKATEQWQLLSIEDKKMYLDKTDQDFDNYRKDFKQWQARMMLEGHMRFVNKRELEKVQKRIELLSNKKKKKSTRMKEKIAKLFPQEFISSQQLKSFVNIKYIKEKSSDTTT